MKPLELKQEYVRLRAEGNSFSLIAEKLHVSKSTCSKWEQDLSEEIDDLRRAEFAELYESYGMTKEARIKSLGEILSKINAALDKVDFSEIDPTKLLDFKLKYTEALKAEYVGKKPLIAQEGIGVEDIVNAFADLLNRVSAGEITTDQAQKDSLILSNLLKAYETTEVKAKLDELEAIVGGRQ